MNVNMASIVTKDDFLTVSNADACLQAFAKYMSDRYKFDVNDKSVSVDPKKLMFVVMQQVANSSKDGSADTRKLNNIVLNTARDYYVQQFALNGQATQVHERDFELHGRRKVPDESAVPMPTINTREKVSVPPPRYEDLSNSTVVPPKIPNELVAQRENTIDEQALLQRLEDERKRRMSEVPTPVPAGDELEQPAVQIPSYDEVCNDPPPAFANHNQDAIIKPPRWNFEVVEKYLALNGFDRDWSQQKERFKFSVEFSDGANTKDVRWIEISKIIIPSEIRDVRTMTNIPKQHFNHSFDFGFQYVSLHIDEFTGVYIGNDNAFAHLVFDTSYCSQNGRGYVVLKPMSTERLNFTPSPLSSLSRLSLTLLRPSGQLFNDSRDAYTIWSISHEPINQTYLRVTTTTFHDKNEFAVKDTIAFFGYSMMPHETSTVSQAAYNRFVSFVNRSQGHEIMQISQPNCDGYFRGFYIKAPGKFNALTGVYEVDQDMIAALTEYNDAHGPFVTPSTNGDIINQSLQVSAMFTLGVEQAIAHPSRNS